MILYINTTAPDEMIIALRSGTKVIARRKIKSVRNQAEKLVPEIDALLKKNRVAPRQLKKIIVAARGGRFTSLRIGVITANALAYALKIPVEAEEISDESGRPVVIKTKKFDIYSLVEPLYDREPTIGQSKKPLP